MLRALARLLKLLNSEVEPGQISLGVCLALIMGFTPLWSLHNLLVLLLVLILRVNLSAFLVSFAFFSLVAYALDPLFGSLGLAILTASPLEGLWTWLYNTALGRLEAFNDTVTMGSSIVSLVLFAPLYLLCSRLIAKYREQVLAWVRRTKLMQALRASRFYRVYADTAGWAG